MIGEVLAEVRKDNHDTQQDLADQLNVSVSTVRSWENEKSTPSHEMLVKICQLYQVSADYLLGLTRVDPVYEQRKRQKLFTEEERAALRSFEEYLLWRRRAAARSRKEPR